MSKLHLKTEHLVIRDFVEEDWQDIVEMRTQEEVARYEPWDTTTWAERERVVERIREQRALTFELGKYTEFAALLGNKAIGSVGVKRLSDVHKNAEVGWVFRRSLLGSRLRHRSRPRPDGLELSDTRASPHHRRMRRPQRLLVPAHGTPRDAARSPPRQELLLERGVDRRPRVRGPQRRMAAPSTAPLHRSCARST